MPKPYSIDLRERVVAAVETGGLSRRASASQFGVGVPGSRTCSLTLWTDMRVQAVGRRATRFAAALWFFAAVSIVCAAEVFGSGLAVSMTTDKAVYAPGEPIRINLEVANRGTTPVILDFASAQRFDVSILDGGGAEVWRWSAGRMFASVLGRETLVPDRPRLVYDAIFANGLELGPYRIRAWLTDRTLRFSGSLGVWVR